MVSLKTFIKETLSEVTEALCEFEQTEKERGRDVTPFPSLYSQKDSSEFHVGLVGQEGYERFHMIMPMEFDVAVTATSADESSAGAGLKVVEMFRAGIDTKEASTHGSVSRVRFKVPVQLARTE